MDLDTLLDSSRYIVRCDKLNHYCICYWCLLIPGLFNLQAILRQVNPMIQSYIKFHQVKLRHTICAVLGSSGLQSVSLYAQPVLI